MSVKIIVDSCVDLPEETIRELDIEVVPLTITLGQDHYLDRVELSPDDFYHKISQEGHLPKTAQPSPERYLEAFKKYGQKGQQILCLCVSSKLSGSYNSALLAKKMASPELEIEVVDSLSGSVGLGMLALKCGKWAKSGRSLEEISQDVKYYAKDLSVYSILDTVEYSVKGGRLTAAKHMINNILNFKVILEAKSGNVAIIDKVRGTKKAYERVACLVAEKTAKQEIPLFGIGHVKNAEGANQLGALIKQFQQNAEYIITSISASMASHIGFGGIVLAF